MQSSNSVSEKEVDFVGLLSKHCSEGDTGIIFVATNDNRSCKIFLSEGQIEAISMARSNAKAAPLELRRSGVKSCSFSDRIKLSRRKEDIVESSREALIQLGCHSLKAM